MALFQTHRPLLGLATAASLALCACETRQAEAPTNPVANHTGAAAESKPTYSAMPTIRTHRPRIDVDAPTTIETATFALG